MRADQASVFLRALGCTKISVGMNWVRSTCPFGYLHTRGKDQVPSFAISINDGDESHCRCQACGVYGALIPLLWRLNRSDLLPFLQATNQLDVWKHFPEETKSALKQKAEKVARYGFYDQPQAEPEPSRFEPQSEVPEEVLDQMKAWMSDGVRKYLMEKRGLEPLTIAEWELGWMPKENRLCVPIRDETGKLVSISGRLLVKDDAGEWTDKLPAHEPGGRRLIKYLHSEFRRNIVLYGMHRVTDARVGFLHEGFFQTIATAQLGYPNALARMGTHLSPEQIAFLEKRLDHLVIVPDGDKMGRKSAADIVERLSHRKRPISRISVAEMPDGKDADQLRPSHLRAILENSLTT